MYVITTETYKTGARVQLSIGMLQFLVFNKIRNLDEIDKRKLVIMCLPRKISVDDKLRISLVLRYLVSMENELLVMKLSVSADVADVCI